jgi:hypothetical protein
MDADVLANGQAAFKNNVIAMDYTFNSTVTGATGLALAAENAATTTYLNNPANGNNVLSTPCDVLVNAWDFLNPDYRPNSGATSGAALSGADLTPGINLSTTLFSANQTAELVVDVYENAVGNSNGTITVSIPVPSGFTIAVPSIATLSSTPTSGTNGTSTALQMAYNNADWNFSLSGTFVIATSKAGISIPQNGMSSLGFTIKRNTTTPAGTNTNLVVNVTGGSDSTPENNSTNNSLSTL